MRFLNNMLNATSSLNSRVFLQHQLLLAGLDIDALEKVGILSINLSFEQWIWNLFSKDMKGHPISLFFILFYSSIYLLFVFL